ncbi:MAG: bifunctional oligoribonuclease/PAP phosphatase NrnA [Clostridia bacterium]|nr:bifunctional oligoribonuclease/PAP phosphatase NrnA [Clostridia bacterium]
MNSLKEIAVYLKQNNNYAVIVHKNPDGDCLGCAGALCLALRNMGKNASVVLPNPHSPRHDFIWDKNLEEAQFTPECAVCVDVASISQMGIAYDEHFKKLSASCCIDHHGTNEGFADFNYIDAKSAACGEIIYELLREMEAQITIPIAKFLLVAIADDTGSFQYSNTSSATHMIVSELYKIIPDPEPIMRALYGTHTKQEIDTLKEIVPSLEYHMDGKVCFMFANIEKIKSIGADPSNVDAWVGLPRSVKGVEVAAVFKILSDNEVKVSFRSNDYVDVSDLASKFGGGGHIRASGATFFESADSAKKKILQELKKLV